MAESHAPWALFWEGIDVFDMEDREENSRRFGAQPHEYFIFATGLAKRFAPMVKMKTGVQVMGLQDTGTNLLAQLLYKNFGGQLVHYDSTASLEKRGVWKHASPAWIDAKVPQAFDNLKNHTVVPVVMVRNPLSWLRSIKKAPYELAKCVDGDDWLEKPCAHNFPAGYVKESFGMKLKAQFQHLTGLWARWTESYEPILRKHFGKVLIVRYEDLVQHTEHVVRRIGNTLQLTLPDQIDIIETPAKSHGAALGHEAAMERIHNKEYMEEFTDDELSLVCDQLKFFADVMIKYGYSDCRQILRVPIEPVWD